MVEPVLLDAGPIGLLCHSSHGNPEVAAIRRWLKERERARQIVCLPEIVDYEVRRELLRLANLESLARLEALGRRLHYLRITTSVMRRAADLWAQARRQGVPTAPDPALDGDMILAAFAERESAVVATDNVRHLARFVPAKSWRDIP